MKTFQSFWAGVLTVAVATLTACGGGGGGGGSSGSNGLPATLQSIEVQADQTSVPAGNSTTLHAIGHFSDGSTADITESASASSRRALTNVSWTASNSSVANFLTPSINSLQTKVPGTVVVTATDFLSGVTGTLTVNVSAPIQQALSINGLSNNQTISVRTNTQLTALAVKTDGSTQAATPVTWMSSNTAVATIDSNGNFAGVAAGSVAITATSGSYTKVINLTLLTPLSTPKFTLSCNPSNPTVINSSQWNNQYAIDSFNATEWVVVDGASCQGYASVGFWVAQTGGGTLYYARFYAVRSPGNPTVFQPGSTYGPLASRQKVTVGQATSTALTFLGSFSEIYTLITQ